MPADQMIVFHCPQCGGKLQVPAQMAGVTGPCPKCSANITAPGATPPTAAGTAAVPGPLVTEPIPRQTSPEDQSPAQHQAASTGQSVSPSAGSHPESVLENIRSQSNQASEETSQTAQPNSTTQTRASNGPVNHRAGGPDSGQRRIPDSRFTRAVQNTSSRSTRSQWLSVMFPIAFVVIAAVLVLAVLHLAGVYSAWDLKRSSDGLISGQALEPATNTADEPSTEPPLTPVERDPAMSKPAGQDPATISTDSGQDANAPVSAPADPAPAENITPPTGSTSPSEDKSGQPQANDFVSVTARRPLIKNVTEEGEFPELKLPPATSGTRGPDKGSQAPREASEPPPPNTSSLSPPNKSATPLTKQNSPSPQKAGFLANQNLEQFLKAKSLGERIAVMNKSKLTHEQLMASSLGGELKPFKRIRLMEIVPRPEDNLMQYLYFVTFEDPDEDMERLRILVQLVERPGIHPPLIHTDAFIEHYQKQLPLYAKQPSRKVTTFHCIAEARTCDLAEEIPEEQKESMIRLAIKSHPFNPTIFNAYLNKKSPLMEHIGNSKSFPYTEPRFCVMSFRWNTSNPEYPYIELTDIVGTGWEK